MNWFKRFRRQKKLVYYVQKYANEQDLQSAQQLQSFFSRAFQSSEKYSNYINKLYHE